MRFSSRFGVLKNTKNRIINLTAAAVLAATGMGGSLPLFLSQKVAAMAPQYYVRTDGSDTNCDGTLDLADTGTPGSSCAKATVQAGINAAGSNAKLNVRPGTYSATQYLVLAGHEGLRIVGAGKNTTILQLTAASDGFKVQANDVTLKNFTIDGTTTANYGLRAQGVDNLTASNLKAINMKKTGFDINGVTNSSFTGLTATNNGGNGFSVTDTENLTFTNTSTSNNAWGGMGIYTHGGAFPGRCGVDGITFTGTTNLQETGALYTGIDSVTCTSIANLNVPTDMLPYKVTLNKADPQDIYVKSSVDATTIASVFSGYAPVAMTTADGNYYVTTGFKIQDAINAASAGDTVNVAAGTYTENVNVAKAVTINGAQAGVDARTRSGSESQVGSFTVTKDDVVIDGFSFNGGSNQINVAPSPATGVTLSGLVFQNNVFSGYASVALTTNNAGNIVVQKNLFEDVSGAGESMQFRSNGAPGSCSDTQVLDNDFVNASNNNSADVNFSCTGSASTNVLVSGNTTTGSTASFVAFSGVSGGIDVHGNTATGVQDNSAIFFFGSVTGSVDIYGNQFNDSNANAVGIVGGDYTGENPNTGTFTITNNDFSNNAGGISVSASGFGNGGTLVAHNNNLTNTGVGVKNSTSTLIDASANWWGHVDGPLASQYSGPVTVAPWCSWEDCSSYETGQTLSLQSTGGVAQTPNVVTVLTGSSSAGNVRVVLPQNVTVTGDPAWDGTINAPTASNYTVAGAASTGIAITVGSNNYSLTFDRAVQLYFPGQGGKSVGFKAPGGNFTEITTTCETFDPATADSQLAAASANECKMTYNGDLYVWTKHFTMFATFKPASKPSNTTSSSSSTAKTTVAASTVHSAANNAASVLGIASGTDSDSTKTPATTNKSKDDNKDTSSNFLGLGWWWILVLAAVAALGYLGVVRRADR